MDVDTHGDDAAEIDLGDDTLDAPGQRAPENRVEDALFKVFASFNKSGINANTMLRLHRDEVSSILEDQGYLPLTKEESDIQLLKCNIDSDKIGPGGEKEQLKWPALKGKGATKNPHAPKSGVVEPTLVFPEFGEDVPILLEVARYLRDHPENDDVMRELASNLALQQMGTIPMPTTEISVVDLLEERAMVADESFKVAEKRNGEKWGTREKAFLDLLNDPGPEPPIAEEKSTRSRISRDQSVNSEALISSSIKPKGQKRTTRETSQTSSLGTKKNK